MDAPASLRADMNLTELCPPEICFLNTSELIKLSVKSDRTMPRSENYVSGASGVVTEFFWNKETVSAILISPNVFGRFRKAGRARQKHPDDRNL